MVFISWNVNGLRACMKKGFLDFYQSRRPDFLCLQETKMERGQAALPLEEGVLRNRHLHPPRPRRRGPGHGRRAA